MFKKFITGIMAGIIVIAVVMTAGCVSSVVSVDDDEQIEEQAPVEIVCAQDTEDEPVWFVTSFPDKKSDSSSEEGPLGFVFNRDFGINEPVEDPWLYEWDFQKDAEFPEAPDLNLQPKEKKDRLDRQTPKEGGIEGDPWLYEPVEPTGTKAWFGLDPHDEDFGKEQSVKFPGHQVKDSVRDEDIPRFGVGASDEAFDEDEPEEDHTEDKPSVPEVVTDGRKEPTSVNPNTGADPRMNCTFQPNQAGHDGGALSPDKDRHADKGFDEGSFARAA